MGGMLHIKSRPTANSLKSKSADTGTGIHAGKFDENLRAVFLDKRNRNGLGLWQSSKKSSIYTAERLTLNQRKRKARALRSDCRKHRNYAARKRIFAVKINSDFRALKIHSTRHNFAFKQDIFRIQQDIFRIRQDVFGIRQDIFDIRQDVFCIRQDIFLIRQDVFRIRRDVFRIRQS